MEKYKLLKKFPDETTYRDIFNELTYKELQALLSYIRNSSGESVVSTENGLLQRIPGIGLTEYRAVKLKAKTEQHVS